jgi:pyrroline-5-carboxylate reductase
MRTYKKYQIGFIGCGHMGMAIAKGAIAKEYLERNQICVYDPSEAVRKACDRQAFKVFDSEKEIIRNAHLVCLAVKPQDIDAVLENMKGEPIDTLISIVTGVTIAHLQEALDNVPVIRAVPNTPLQISEGATAMCKSENCRADEYDFVFQLFNSMGLTRTIPEDKMNEIIALSGSTPAYVYYFINCILKDAVKRGIDDMDARALLVQTVIGSANLLKKNPKISIEEFIDEVCTPGGTTIEAIESMRSQGLDKLIHEANDKCINRAIELG